MVRCAIEFYFCPVYRNNTSYVSSVTIFLTGFSCNPSNPDRIHGNTGNIITTLSSVRTARRGCRVEMNRAISRTLIPRLYAGVDPVLIITTGVVDYY